MAFTGSALRPGDPLAECSLNSRGRRRPHGPNRWYQDVEDDVTDAGGIRDPALHRGRPGYRRADARGRSQRGRWACRTVDASANRCWAGRAESHLFEYAPSRPRRSGQRRSRRATPSWPSWAPRTEPTRPGVRSGLHAQRLHGRTVPTSSPAYRAATSARSSWSRTSTRSPPPGAADDGTGVVAFLEVARRPSCRLPSTTTVIFLFTDGEERGLLGSQAFLLDHPCAFRVGVVLNLDSAARRRPCSCSRPVPRRASGAGAPVHGRPVYTSSLMYEVSRRSPSSATSALSRSTTAPHELRLARRPRLRHTAYDRIANLTRRACSTRGTTLALTRRLAGCRSGPARAPDIVAFDVVGRPRRVLPGRRGRRPLVAVAVALVGATVILLAVAPPLVTLRGVGVGLGARGRRRAR